MIIHYEDFGVSNSGGQFETPETSMAEMAEMAVADFFGDGEIGIIEPPSKTVYVRLRLYHVTFTAKGEYCVKNTL